LKDETVIRLALLVTGAILLIVHAFTGSNGALVSAGASLIGAGAGIVQERRKAKE
jgi:disulfide bond formation protein DsbB